MEVNGQLHNPVTLTSLLTLGDTFHGNRWVRDWVTSKVGLDALKKLEQERIVKSVMVKI